MSPRSQHSKYRAPRQAVVGAFLLGALTTGCKNSVAEDLVAPAHPVYTVQQRLAVDWRYGSHTYELGSVYEDDLGHAYQLDTLRFLITGARAVDDNGAVLASYANVYALADAAGSSEFFLGDLTSGHLHEIEFSIGLEPTMNHTDPAVAPASLTTTGMHSGNATAGYAFLIVAGRVDSNGDGSLDGNDQHFSYHCIGDALLCPTAAVVHANLLENGVLTAWLPVNMEVLMADIDLLNTPGTADDGPVNMAWMQRLMDAIEQEH